MKLSYYYPMIIRVRFVPKRWMSLEIIVQSAIKMVWYNYRPSWKSRALQKHKHIMSILPEMPPRFIVVLEHTTKATVM